MNFSQNMFNNNGQNAQNQVQAINNFINTQMPVGSEGFNNNNLIPNLNYQSNTNTMDQNLMKPQFASQNTMGGYIDDLKFKNMNQNYTNSFLNKKKNKQSNFQPQPQESYVNGGFSMSMDN